ncbi:MAG: Ig-like domain repeat protein [Candidatus Riflebacteria bacterium]|nr:Ig-like domain repeat protein [Candidatus Riflebacteria bacterium]
MKRWLWAIWLLTLAGAGLGQTVTAIQVSDPPAPYNRVTNRPSIVVSFTLTGFQTPVQVQFQRDDGARDTLTGLQNGPNSITLVLNDMTNTERVVSWNVVATGSTGSPVLVFNAVRIFYDNVAPRPPTTVSPAFPATVYGDSMTIRGSVVSSVGGAPVLTGTVYVRQPRPPTDPTGTVIGAGAILSNPPGSYTATVLLSTITTGVATQLSLTAEDEAGNASSPVVVTVTRLLAPSPTFSVVPSCQPPTGGLVNNPAVLVRGAVTGQLPPFNVNFFVDGFLESQTAGLADNEQFAHTLNMPGQGQHTIAVQATNSNQPPDRSRATFACVLTLDSLPPGPPLILQPNPTMGSYLTTGPTFNIQGISTERPFCTTSPACPRPRILLAAPQGVTFNPVSPLAPNDANGQFTTTAQLAPQLADGQYTIQVISVDAAGNTSPGASAQILFTVDRTPPGVDEIRINGIQAPQQNPPIFVGRNTSEVRVRMTDPMSIGPTVRFQQSGGSAVELGLTSGTARLWTYAFTPVTNQDGPVSATISGGRDLAGNPASAAFSRLFIVDTTPPTVVSVEPGTITTLVNRTPTAIRITLRDPPDGTGAFSGVDTAGTRVTVEGPVGTGTPTPVPGTLVPYDPQTVDFIPQAQLVGDGEYRIRIVAVDKVGNISAEIVRTFTLDTTPIRILPGMLQFQPACGSFVNPTSMPGGSATPFVQVTVNDPQFDAATSEIEVDDFCRAPPRVPGTKSVVSSSTIRYTFTSPLATDGSQDGTYAIGVILHDRAGNTSPQTWCTFIYDSLPPLVDRTWPQDGGCAVGPLRHVDATMLDPVPDTCRGKSGIDRNRSTLRLYLQQPNSFYNKKTPAEVRGVLRFVSVGNIDRVLLEIVDQYNVPVGLKNDGSDDGIYRLDTQAFDRAGNSSPIVSSTFTYDTLPPDLIVDKLKSGDTLAGPALTITGNTRDNSGGKDIDRVSASLISVDRDGNPTTSVPVFANVTAAIDPLPVPSSGTPPRRRWTLNVSLVSVTTPTWGRLTISSYDRCGNFRDQGFTVWLQPDRLAAPILSIPGIGLCTNSNFVDFAWSGVSGASAYQIRIRTPKGNEIYKNTGGPPNVKVNLGLTNDGDGQYLWSAAGIDGGLQLGYFAPNQVLNINTSPPRVIAVDVQDASPNSRGVITAGENRVVITFHENMRCGAGLSVKLVPENKSAPPLVVTTVSCDQNVWTGRLMVPENNGRGPDYNGLGEFAIELGRDCAGNLMAVPNHGLVVYEVNTGPFLRAAVFQNPVDKRDLVVLIKGYRRDGGLPTRLIDLPVATFTRPGEPAQSPVLNRINDSTFQGLYRLSPYSTAPIALTVSARDEWGNPATFGIALNVVQVSPTEAYVINPTSAVSLALAPQSVSEPVSIIPIARARSLLSQDSIFTDAKNQRLVPVAPLDQFGPVGLQFNKPAKLTVDLTRLGTGIQTGLIAKSSLFQRVGDRWEYVPQSRSGETIAAQVSTLYPIALLQDPVGPDISIEKPGPEGRLQPGQTEVSATVTDVGAGLEPSSVKVLVDDRPIEATVDRESGRVTAGLPRLEAGEHRLAIAAADRAGNVTRSSQKLVAPGGFGVTELVPFPNPARLYSRIRYRLKGAADRVDIRIYDVAGRLVRRLDGTAVAGENTAEWALDTDDGSGVASGVYPVRVIVTASGQKTTARTKIAVLR